MNIDYEAVATENIDFLEESFDVITACQCFWYFDHEKVMPNLYRMLKSGGKLLILYMAWSDESLPWCRGIAFRRRTAVMGRGTSEAALGNCTG